MSDHDWIENKRKAIEFNVTMATKIERDRCIKVAKGCKSMNGGYGDGPEWDAFQHGIQTVVNALSDDPDAYSVRVLEEMGSEA